MPRKSLTLLSLGAALLLLGAGVASAKAVKLKIDCSPTGKAKVILNYSDDEDQVIVNVNCSGLAPETTYVVAVFDDLATPVASEEFTTKPDKSKGKAKGHKKDNGKGKKKNFKSKGHVNIHIPWVLPEPLPGEPPPEPPDLTAWTVTVEVLVEAPPEPEPEP